MIWILVFVIPTTITPFDWLKMRDGERALAGDSVMTMGPTFATKEACIKAGKGYPKRGKMGWQGDARFCMPVESID